MGYCFQNVSPTKTFLCHKQALLLGMVGLKIGHHLEVTKLVWGNFVTKNNSCQSGKKSSEEILFGFLPHNNTRGHKYLSKYVCTV
mmetsp:Transcript_353/g.696  ORF Transcript_353/g.696 Transcript_353/m.696 type:complete len:85 (+) Transcript_353:145-399(+)